jgi:SAM-dependent MidA family methyltransferase
LAVEGDEDGLRDRWLALFTPGLGDALDRLWPTAAGVADGYQSEINLRLEPWTRALVERMRRGYLVMIDYGYPRHEYYHPERNQGTWICHFRHRAYADPYLLPGLQDMTAHVDFSALAEAAQRHGLRLAGYTTQSHFLIDSGLERLLARSNPNDVQRHIQLMQGVKRLTLPSEMGEKFKVMALALKAPTELSGFVTRDLRARL